MPVFIVMGREAYGPSWVEEVCSREEDAILIQKKLELQAREECLDSTSYYITERELI